MPGGYEALEIDVKKILLEDSDERIGPGMFCDGSINICNMIR